MFSGKSDTKQFGMLLDRTDNPDEELRENVCNPSRFCDINRKYPR